MRQIKFRAWDNLSPKMYTGHSLSISANGTIAFLDDDGNWKEPEAGRMKVMQYTGLKDRNRNEIYEGDIIKGFSKHFQEWQHKVVVWDTYKWELEPTLGVTLGSEIEVIGNIHEHPELLTPSFNRP